MTPILTAEEAAKYLKVPETTLRRMCRLRQVPSFKTGKHWRLRKEALDEWMREQEQSSAPQRSRQEEQ